VAFLRATGSYVPDRVVGNAELASRVAETATWIEQVSGILERRYAAPDQTVTELAVLAAERCLQSSSLAAGDLGMLLVSSGSSERFCPGPASAVAARLGLGTTPALDIPVGSAGSLIGLALAMRLAPTTGNILVVGAEVMSRRIDATPEGRNTAILFGDGAGAALVSPDAGFLKLVDAALFTDGSGAEILRMEGGRLHMDGGSVILRASRKLPTCITEVLQRNGLTPADVPHYLLHQANLNLLTKVAATLKVPSERFFTNIQHYGNTSSASLLLALDEWRSGSHIDGPVLFSAFGTGLNWGAMLALPADFTLATPSRPATR
jgi:3-oxoacyl-[acyl-carrier-protein] synthase-3